MQANSASRHAVINVVGLSRSLVGADTPGISAWAKRHETTSFPPVFPALTCSAQATYLTGLPPAEHGIVGNGWYDRAYAEPRFWKQSNRLVHGEKLWEAMRRKRPGFTCAKLFWWYNMYSSADWSVTPRPLYLADGGKVFDIHTHPLELRPQLKADLGEFPFPAFWGPMAGIASSKWIAAAARYLEHKHQPDLSLIYLPHLDYCLQKYGSGAPESRRELQALDKLVADLLTWLEERGIQPIILSEYGISAVSRPVHINRLLRQQGWLSIKDELGRETLDYGACKVLAIPDHQIAHIYLQEHKLKSQVAALLQSTPGIAHVRETPFGTSGAAHERGGNLVAVAAPDSWFTYYHWEEDAKAPDYARTVDIHRKPGYDPCELFIDPAIRHPKLKLAHFLLRKKLGFRTLMDAIPLDATLVRGSHGSDHVPIDEQPILIGPGASQVCSAPHLFPYLLKRL